MEKNKAKQYFGRGKNPVSQKNLKKWGPGQSGNPGGRPTKFRNLSESLLAYADKKGLKNIWDDKENVYLKKENDLTYKEEVLEIIWKQARLGSLKHIQLLASLGCLDKK